MKSSKTKNIISVLVVVLIVAGFLRMFVVEGFIVSGDSMAPTILPGDFVIVNRLAYRSSDPTRNDIIVVEPRNYEKKIIKRVIGLPDERVEIIDKKVTIKQGRQDDGVVLAEEYLEFKDTPEIGKTIITLDPREYYVLGDNRFVSLDSRILGPVDHWDIKGKVIFQFSLRRFKAAFY